MKKASTIGTLLILAALLAGCTGNKSAQLNTGAAGQQQPANAQSNKVKEETPTASPSMDDSNDDVKQLDTMTSQMDPNDFSDSNVPN